MSTHMIQKNIETEMEEIGEMNRWQSLWEEQLLCVLPSFFSCLSSLGQRKKMTELRVHLVKSSSARTFKCLEAF
ncbi:hypothetical protein ACFX2I_010566 [Malus domestica]